MSPRPARRQARVDVPDLSNRVALQQIPKPLDVGAPPQLQNELGLWSPVSSQLSFLTEHAIVALHLCIPTREDVRARKCTIRSGIRSKITRRSLLDVARTAAQKLCKGGPHERRARRAPMRTTVREAGPGAVRFIDLVRGNEEATVQMTADKGKVAASQRPDDLQP